VREGDDLAPQPIIGKEAMARPPRAYALSGSTLISFNPTSPSVGTSISITGVTAGQTLVGIDFRPLDGLLYSLGVNATTDTATLYAISTRTGIATVVGSVGGFADLPAGGYGFDFNPSVDRIRVTTETGLNFRLNPNNGALAGLDTMIAGGGIAAAAYTNNQLNNGNVTTLYTLNSITDVLNIQSPANGGVQIAVGPTGVDFTSVNGFDIPAGVNALVNSGPASGFGFALLTVAGVTGVYSINLATGAATAVGNLLGGAPMNGFTIQNVFDPVPVNDFNGDGLSELLWQNTDGTPAIWQVDGLNLVAGSNAGFNPGAAWHVIGSGDFNDDGMADILWQNADGTPAAWLMNGSNILSGANVGFNPGPAWQVQAAGDFNGDSKADILWQNADGTPAIWLMDGLTLLSGANVGSNPGPAWHVQAAGDFNGDDKADILWQNDNGQAAVWLMDGHALISGSDVGSNPGPSWHVQAAADFNGDGKADILWQNADGTPAIWLMDGTSLISGQNVGFNPGPAWQVHGAGDFNGDGKADIQWQNTDGTPAVWLMDGFIAQSVGSIGFNPGAVWQLIPQNQDLL
jgi:hypothetical protein